MRAAVALILFNRPDTTERVFGEIAAARPQKLFLIADGPRQNNAADIEKCAAARGVVERVDWPCEVYKNYAASNMGCGVRPATGIDWVFEHVEEAVILEDDCAPHSTFFRFCDELLERYRVDRRIVQICGNNFQFGRKRGPHSYFYSYHNMCAGGWATWRRAWQSHDMAVSAWPQLKQTDWLHRIVHNAQAEKYWAAQFDRAYDSGGQVDFWDYQWTFSCWAQGGLSVVPNVTLLSNIGFRPDGTHTKARDITANLQLEAMAFPLMHPPRVVRNRAADKFIIDHVVMRKESFVRYWRRRFLKLYERAPSVLKRPLAALKKACGFSPQ